MQYSMATFNGVGDYVTTRTYVSTNDQRACPACPFVSSSKTIPCQFSSVQLHRIDAALRFTCYPVNISQLYLERTWAHCPRTICRYDSGCTCHRSARSRHRRSTVPGLGADDCGTSPDRSWCFGASPCTVLRARISCLRLISACHRINAAAATVLL